MAKTFDNVNSGLVKASAILPIVGGGSLVVQFLWFTVSISLYLSFGSVLYLVISALAIVGGVLAIRRVFMVAPWLLVASAVLGLVSQFVDYGLFYWPWFALMNVNDIFGLYGVIHGFILFVSLYAWWLIAIGAVLALIAFFRGSSDAPVPSKAMATQGGVAVVLADGSVVEGWYADPNGLPSERYWDGTEWTDRTRPRTTVTAGGGPKPTMTPNGEPISEKSRAAAAILCWFLGVLGIHRFYVGKVGTGIAQLFTLGGLGIWALIDFIMILVGSFKDINGKVLSNW